ncbi:MAG: DUF4442 domain-containing protein [Marinifilaceae bacterium]|jgi:acyl-coenzyme A thioesterase PaaI-like protein|nr:DUF4442 domain-containing protein [Marinifilaceae bacterium]
MPNYKRIFDFASRFWKRNKVLKFGFNYSPVYRRTTGRIIEISEDILFIKVKLALSYKNRNYVGSLFGGTLFSAVDPFPMFQIMQALGNDYIVWDKSAEIKFKRPAYEDLYAEFILTHQEIQEIKQQLQAQKEIEIKKCTQLTNKDKTKIYCEVIKTIYITTKSYYKEKQATKGKQ